MGFQRPEGIKPTKREGLTRVSLDLTDDEIRLLDALVARTKAKTRVRLLRYLLRAWALVVAASTGGWEEARLSLTVKTPEGKTKAKPVEEAKWD